MNEEVEAYLSKSTESLASAKNDLTKKRYNSCANRAYYACYQAAVALLIKHGIKPTSKKGLRRHETVQAQIAVLIKREKVLPAEHRGTLQELITARITADYEAEMINKKRANRVLKKAEEFVSLVVKGVSKP
jgi:uncharacterized protein (UPF0332 family)